MGSSSKTTLDSARHDFSSHPRHSQPGRPSGAHKAGNSSALDVLTRGSALLLAGSAWLRGGHALSTGGLGGGRHMLQECSRPGIVGVNAFAVNVAESALQGLPATAGAVASGTAWQMFQVNGCQQRINPVPGPVNLTYAFDATPGTGRTDIGNARPVDAAQRALLSAAFGNLTSALDINFVEVSGESADQANLQVVQADATPPKIPAGTYSLGPGDGLTGQTTSQLVVVGDTVVDTLQGVGGALGLTTFNTGVVQNATLPTNGDGWLSSVMGSKSIPCFAVNTFGASDWSALQAAYNLAPSLANGTSFALTNQTLTGGLLASGSNNTLRAKSDGAVVLNLGNAPTDISHLGNARITLAPTANITGGDISAAHGGYLLGNQFNNTLVGGDGNSIIDPIGGTNNTVTAGVGQNIVVLQDAPGTLTINDFKLSDDRLGAQFAVPLNRVKIQDTSSQNGQVRLGFANGQNVTLRGIPAHGFVGLLTLNDILLEDFTYTLPADCGTVVPVAPAPSVPPLAPGLAPTQAPGTAPTPAPGIAPTPAPGTAPTPAPSTAPTPAPSVTPPNPNVGPAPSPAPNPPPPPSPPPPPPVSPPSPVSPPPNPPTPPGQQPHPSHLGLILGLSLPLGIGAIVLTGVIIGCCCVGGGGGGGGRPRRRPDGENRQPDPSPPGPLPPPNQPRADGPHYDVPVR